GTFLRFGDPAKHELLQRAAGNQPDQRNLASAILGAWGAWSWLPSDVAAIHAALKVSPGGWLVRPLAKIGTAEAIDALIEDLPAADEGNETVKALADIGPKVLPRLLPLLADDRRAAKAGAVVRQMGIDAFSVAPDWLSRATSADAPKAE